MLDECFNKDQFLCEDKEGKNINRAEKWIKQNHPEVIGQTFEDGTTITPRILTQEIRNTVPNVRMADCKFLVGATRMYFDLQNDVHEFQSKMNKLNKMLKIICIAHVDEYDNNFNGLSFDELDKKFSGAVKKELDDDRAQISKLQLIKNAAYKIVPIDSFDEASKYGKYTSWCVTHHPDMYNSYTKGGLGRFYFCLQDGFEDVLKVKGEGCPMDAYGKSMIAISVNDDGSLNTCTCRWNHDNGGNDSMMDTKEISQFFGIDFYKTFKPYDVDQLWKKILEKQIPSRKLDDKNAEFCKTFGCVAIYANDDEDEDVDSLVDFKKLVDGKIVTLPYVDKTTTYINNKFVTMKDGKFVVAVPKTIQNMPQDIRGEFVIPNGVTSIGSGAFFQCRGLKSVTIPNSVTSIEKWAFSRCTSLTSVTIGNNVTSIGSGAFFNCISLTSVTIPDSVTDIGNRAFISCHSLTNVTIGNGVTSIGEYAFGNCYGLTNVTIGNSVTSIGYQAFGYCTSLTNVVMPNSVISIGNNAFYRCSNLQSIVFKGKTFEEVQSMKNYPFGIEDKSIIKYKK